jgi:hypothetical protein
MAALTIAQEYAAVREAIQALTTTGQSVVSFTVDGMTVTYNSNQLQWLQQREIELARRITARNARKRTTPDFS